MSFNECKVQQSPAPVFPARLVPAESGMGWRLVLWPGQLETSRRIYRDKLKARMRWNESCAASHQDTWESREPDTSNFCFIKGNFICVDIEVCLMLFIFKFRFSYSVYSKIYHYYISMATVSTLITVWESRNGDEPVLEDLELGADAEGEGGELLGGERVPVPQRAAQVVLLVIVVTPARTRPTLWSLSSPLWMAWRIDLSFALQKEEKEGRIDFAGNGSTYFRGK